MERNTIIRFKGVSREFIAADGAVRVLNDVDFAVERNSFTVIFGPSGSGKTTILNIILGLLPPTSGTVLVNGQNLYALSQDERANFRAGHYGMVSQTNSWINSLSVVENIAMPLYYRGYSHAEAMKQAIISLNRVDMGKYANYRPTVLSVGQQQRIQMARATVDTPMILVADEPTGSLDSKTGDQIMQLITSFKNHGDTTVILVTHNADYISLSDHRIFIRDGELVDDEGGYHGGENPDRVKLANAFSTALAEADKQKTVSVVTKPVKAAKPTVAKPAGMKSQAQTKPKRGKK